MPEANWASPQGAFMSEPDQVASQEKPKPEDDQAAPHAMCEADMALYIEFALPCDSREDIIACRPCPKEVTLARCTGGYTIFGPCWPEGAHQAMDTLLGGPGPP